MSRLQPHPPNLPAPELDRKAWLFALATAFFATMGVGIISPVVPFLVQPYVSNANDLAFLVGLLTSSYAICEFIAAPGLGALSDRYGRRPILLFCLLGSVIGYLLFGIGGALWILFLGRIVDGITGGNISTLFAYVADITPPQKRGQYFGQVGAATGIGFIVGPVIGGVAAHFGYAMPLFVGAALTFANTVWGYFFMPESLDAAMRALAIAPARLNPLTQLGNVFTLAPLRGLFLAIFLYAVPFAVLQSNFAVVAKDALNWQPATIGAVFFAIGVQDIFTQGVLLQRLLPRLGEAKIARLGMIAQLLGYLIVALAVNAAAGALLFVGVVAFAMGEAVMNPSLGALISRAVDAREQGRVQGGNQAVEALARVVGPIFGGQLYASLGRASPYISSALLVALALAVMWRAISFRNVKPSAEGV